MFKIMRSLRSSKCLETTVKLTFTTQKANACNAWTTRSVFNWKYLFWVNLVKKFKIISLSWIFVCFWLEISFWANLVQKFKTVSLCWNFLLDWFEYAELYRKSFSHIFCFRPEKHFLDKSGQKNQNCQFKQKFGTKRLIWICGIQW